MNKNDHRTGSFSQQSTLAFKFNAKPQVHSYYITDNRGGRRDWKACVQSMVVPMAHARHGMPLQDDSTNGTLQYNYGFVCCYVAL